MCSCTRIFSCLLFCLISFLAVKATDPRSLYHTCSFTTNFTRGSTYESNLKALLSNLSTASSSHATGFGTAVIGNTPDTVYGLFLCLGDMSADICTDCVVYAAKNILDRCGGGKGALVWYEECMLRYSDVNFIGLVGLSPTFYMGNTRNNSNPNSTDFGSIGLIYTLIDKAQRSEKLYAAGESEATVSIKRYGMVQCTRDIDANACGSCLDNLTSLVDEYCKGKVGWRVYGSSCMLRYEAYPFFNGSSNTAAPEASPPTNNQTVSLDVPGGTKRSSVRKILLAVIPSAAALVFLVGLCYYFSSRRRGTRKNVKSSEGVLLQNIKGQYLQGPLHDGGIIDEEHDDDQRMHNITLHNILDATNGFSDNNKLGEGGFGPVYKGKLQNGKDVAIKRLSRESSQGLTEFKNEVILIIKLQHRNLVRLLGYCVEEDEKLLIYEFMSNKSLDAFLFDPLKCKELDWEKRLKIIHGMTRGLQYLHEDSRLKIIHRDLKASNILLDGDMNPKISDFGTARIFGVKQTEDNTERIVGTFGYMSPEYALGGLISEKSDIYSFGVLLLDIISGRKETRFTRNNQQLSLIAYAWESWIETEGLDLVDKALKDSYSPKEAMRCVHIALLCVQDHPTERPSVSQIVSMLSNDKELPHPKQPTFTYRNEFNSDQCSTSHDVYSICEATQTTMGGR